MLEAHHNEPGRLIFMRRSIRFVAAGAIALALACVAFAQNGTAYLEGKVTGVDGKPVQGAVLKLERTDGQGHYQVKTDKKGHWMQAGIPLAATFNVSVTIDGKVADTKHNVKSSSDGGTLDFDLSKAKPKA
jgi:Carboxypeptidase regulatory-like domain